MVTCVSLGEVILQWTVVKRLAAGALEPGNIVGVLHALQKFLVVLDGDDDGDGFAFARDDFRFGQRCFHGGNLSGGWLGVKLAALLRELAGLGVEFRQVWQVTVRTCKLASCKAKCFSAKMVR